MHNDTVKKTAIAVYLLAIVILVLGTIGALFFIFNPPCLDDGTAGCEVKDWGATVPVGIVALIFNLLFTGTILMVSHFIIKVSNYIDWRTSSQQQ
jgi:hypothetical protein